MTSRRADEDVDEAMSVELLRTLQSLFIIIVSPPSKVETNWYPLTGKSKLNIFSGSYQQAAPYPLAKTIAFIHPRRTISRKRSQRTVQIPEFDLTVLFFTSGASHILFPLSEHCSYFATPLHFDWLNSLSISLSPFISNNCDKNTNSSSIYGVLTMTRCVILWLYIYYLIYCLEQPYVIEISFIPFYRQENWGMIYMALSQRIPPPLGFNLVVPPIVQWLVYIFWSQSFLGKLLNLSVLWDI